MRLPAIRGFTLIEMLISVALVLVVMLLFTQIFQIATESLSKQRGLAENDQRARMLATIVRNDLAKRTFQDVIPFVNGQDTTLLDLTRRSGYFYYAENNPADDTDDVLQFTSQSVRHARGIDASPYTGKATLLNGTSAAVISEDAVAHQVTVSASYDFSSLMANSSHIWISGSVNTTTGFSNDGRYLLVSPPVYNSGPGTITLNVDSTQPIYVMDAATHGKVSITETQPELDDGIFGNSIGQGSAAEVSYFLRGNNLYRRVLLIRGADVEGVQPRFADGSPVISGGYSSSFWNDFDYSAFCFRGCNTGAGLVGYGPRFHSAGYSLSNDSNPPKELAFSSPPSSPLLARDQFKILSLGCPQVRFGHDPWTGLPKEFVNPGADGQYWTSDDTLFIGRYTLTECADPAFRYPGSMTVNAGDPTQDLSPISMNQAYTLTDQSVDAFSVNNLRRGEDLLLSNVIGFDVKLWDPTWSSGSFVDLGANASGTYGYNSLLNTLYCPISGAVPASSDKRFRYDTWHPAAEVIQPGNPGTRRSSPPFINRLDSSGTAQLPLGAIQVTITYRDRSSDLVRQLTIVHSLIDQ
ncbi:PulJ/GspJ family protein [Schlesneria paludicola]|uniref:PulJ/GspJ family protein n=1 Tax=Schlesneria paludicola TaxID=360056 RepID=UPI00029A0047|nr:prepilin-type N-terminal cleavage/methylation domain-containing protein [Schlesneria paludicola]